MWKSKTTIKPWHCKALKKVPIGRVAVKLNFKWGLLSCILLIDTAFCQKRQFLINFPFFQKHFMKISIFWQKAVSKSKIQESRPYLKFNFTTWLTSPYPLGPFVKLGNVMVWLWSYFFTFLPSNQQFAAQFSYRCNTLSFQHYVKCDSFKSNWWTWTVEKSGFQALRKGFSGSQRCLQFTI